MQLGGPVPASTPDTGDTTIGEVLRVSAARHGHRPAITVLGPERRDEQGFASLLKWTAKGAHLLEIECDAGPGDLVRLVGPAGWAAATVCLAAWWVGTAVTPDTGTDVVAEVVHEPDGRAQDIPTYAIGDAIDGSPTSDADVEAWPTATQLFPDDPPQPRGDGDLLAFRSGETDRSQEQLLAEAARWGPDGVLGVDASVPMELWLPAIVRPLVTGLATVIAAGTSREAAGRENVRVWADG